MIPFAALLAHVDDLVPDAEIDIDETLDLAAAALEEDDPVLERSRLVSRGFVHGRHRRWVAGDSVHQTVLSLTVHEFAAPVQAELSLADLRERLRAAAISDLRATARSLIAHYEDEDGAQLGCASTVSGVYQVIVATRHAPTRQAAMPTTGDQTRINIARPIAERQLAILNELA